MSPWIPAFLCLLADDDYAVREAAQAYLTPRLTLRTMPRGPVESPEARTRLAAIRGACLSRLMDTILPSDVAYWPDSDWADWPRKDIPEFVKDERDGTDEWPYVNARRTTYRVIRAYLVRTHDVKTAQRVIQDVWAAERSAYHTMYAEEWCGRLVDTVDHTASFLPSTLLNPNRR